MVYAQADLRHCWSHIPYCWKSHALAHMVNHFYHIKRPPLNVPILLHMCITCVMGATSMCGASDTDSRLTLWLLIESGYKSDCSLIYAQIKRGDRGVRTLPLENRKNIGLSSITGSDHLKNHNLDQIPTNVLPIVQRQKISTILHIL